MTTEGLDGRLPDENRRTQQQVRDSMLLSQALEERDEEAVSQLTESLPGDIVRQDVLPEVSIDARFWFWELICSEDQFKSLLESMHAGARSILENGHFELGVHYSYAPSQGRTVLLVSHVADQFLQKELPPERYATLQLILRTAPEEVVR